MTNQTQTSPEVSGISGKIASFAYFFTRLGPVPPLLTLVLIAVGAFAYFSLIPRDGLPALQLPIVFISIEHGKGDPIAGDEVASELNAELAKIQDLLDVTTTTDAERISSIVFLDLTVDPKIAAERVNQALANFDSSAPPFVLPISTATIGFDISLSSSTLAVPELEALAFRVAEQLEPRKNVLGAEVTRVTGDVVLPSGEVVTQQISFSRVGLRDESGQLQFGEAVNITLTKSSNIDSVGFSDEIRDVVKNLQTNGTIPSDVEVGFVGDQRVQIDDQISKLQISLVQSLVIVTLVVFILVSWRGAIVSALFVATIMFSTVLALYLIGETLNTISLIGLVIVLGLFVDDIIIVVDAADRELKNGFTKGAAIRAAIGKIGVPDIVGTLTTLVVFFPLLFVPGILGDLVKALPLAVVFALTISLLLSLSIFSWFTAVIVVPGTSGNRVTRKLDKISAIGGRFLGFGERQVRRFVTFYLRSKLATVGVAVAAFLFVVGGIAFVSTLDFEIFPQPDDAPELTIFMAFNDAEDVSDALATAIVVETGIVENFGDSIESVRYGSSDVAGGSMTLELVDRSERDLDGKALGERIEQQFATYERAGVRASSAAGGQLTPDLTVNIRIDSREHAFEVAEAMEEWLSDRPEVAVGQVTRPHNAIVRNANGPLIVADVFLVKDAPDTAIDDLKAAMSDDFPQDLPELGLTADDFDSSNALEDSQQDSFSSLFIIFFVAVIAVAVILVVQFRSILLPGLVLLAIPLAFPLLFPGLLSVDTPLSFFVLLGITTLVGIVVNNTIMLMDYAMKEVNRGAPPRIAIVSALQYRFRAMVTTSITTVVALFPLTSDPQFTGLAWTVIFGLLSSTIFVIFTFPALYVMASGMGKIIRLPRLGRKSAAAKQTDVHSD